jgi:hypothetical protein
VTLICRFGNRPALARLSTGTLGAVCTENMAVERMARAGPKRDRCHDTRPHHILRYQNVIHQLPGLPSFQPDHPCPSPRPLTHLAGDYLAADQEHTVGAETGVAEGEHRVSGGHALPTGFGAFLGQSRKPAENSPLAMGVESAYLTPLNARLTRPVVGQPRATD